MVTRLLITQIFGKPLPREEGLHGNYSFYTILRERTHFAMASRYGFVETILTVVKIIDMHYTTS